MAFPGPEPALPEQTDNSRRWRINRSKASKPMMDQQNYAASRPDSADPEVALAKALGQWPKPAPAKPGLNGAASVEDLAKEVGLKLGDQNELTIRRIKRGKG